MTATADVVGKRGRDWLGNDIVVEAVRDPDVKRYVPCWPILNVAESTVCKR